MASVNLSELVPPPPYTTPVLDKGGVLTQIWLIWFRQLYTRIGQASASSNTTLDSTTGSLQSQVTTVQSSVTGLQSSVTSLSGQVSTINGQITAMQAQATSLQSQITALQNSFVNSKSGTGTVLSTGVQTITIAHGLSGTPANIGVTWKNTSGASDFKFDYPPCIRSVDATNVVVEYKVGTASITATAGITAILTGGV